MNRRDILKQSALILGYAITAPTLAQILSGCKNNKAGGWEPSILTITQLELLSEFAETILPKTSTPGAKDVQLERFVDQILLHTRTSEGQEEFKKGLDEIEKECKVVNNKTFIKCSLDERKAFIATLDKESALTIRSVWGMPLSKNPPKPTFYRQLKGMLIWGYFTSKVVGKNVLNYNPIPGKYEADIPLAQAGKVSFE